MEYIYTGTLPNGLFDVGCTSNITNHIHPGDVRQQHHGRTMMNSQLFRVVEILELADRFFLDHLKQVCESKLQTAVTADTVEYLLPVAQKSNATQLLSICEHLIRNP
jgi:hypothetical protein